MENDISKILTNINSFGGGLAVGGKVIAKNQSNDIASMQEDINTLHTNYNNCVKTSGTQTISGAKTFSSNVTITATPSETNHVARIEDIDFRNTYTIYERPIGFWIDGKPIYRKVISLGTLPNATTKSVAHNISNLESVINIRILVYDTGGNHARFTIPYVYPDASLSQYFIGFEGVDNKNITVITGSDRRNMQATAVIEYTKSTN